MSLGPLEHQPAHLPGLVDENDAVRLTRHDGGIGDRQDGGRIDEDDVVLLPHLAQELIHRRRGQQLRRVGRDRARLDDVQVVQAGRGHDVFHLEPAHEDVGHGPDAVAPAGVADEDVAEFPGSRSMPKKRWRLGRRRLAPTRSVRWPFWAMVMARFTIVVVLPSCSVGLVTTSTLPCRSDRMNWMCVRSVR